MRAALRKVPAGSVTNAVWRQVGIPAGADGASPSKTTPMISANAATLSPCRAPGRCRPIGKELVWFFFFFGRGGESAGEKMKPWHEPADRSLWRRRTRAFYAGSGWETRRKLIVHHGNTAVVLQHPAFTERCVINSITIITSCPVFPPNPPFFLSHFWF